MLDTADTDGLDGDTMEISMRLLTAGLVIVLSM